MFAALLKKQMMENNTWLIQNKKSKKLRSKSGMILLALMCAAIFVIFGFVFYMLGIMLCEPLITMGLGWMYLCMMSFIAITFGVFGSVFSTYTTLYQAKDNEFLLSMPIPPSKILTVRLIGVWIWGLIYEMIVLVPALIAYWVTLKQMGSIDVFVILSGIWTLTVLSIFILTLSCVLGWAVAKVGNKLKGKSFVIVIISVAFIGLYYWVYFHAFGALNYILENAPEIGEKIKGIAAPVYIIGRAGEGDFVSLLIVTIAVASVFIAVRTLMSRSFLKDSTGGRTEKKKKYRESASRVRSISSALLAKEFDRFTSSANYMLNCGLGTVIMPILGVLMLVKADQIQEIFLLNNISSEAAASITCAVLCIMSSVNDISAPSVSLEGKNIRIIQSLPISEWQILKAKIKLHLIITEIPVLFCAVCAIIALHIEPICAVSVLILPASFVVFSAALGLAINLKTPNLEWSSEAVPIKQGVSVILSIFGGWCFVIALCVLYFALNSFIETTVYLAICEVFILLLSITMLFWLKNRGTKIFKSL